MSNRLLILGILAACLVTVVLLGEWLRQQARVGAARQQVNRSFPRSPSASATKEASPTKTVAVRHRLAGTVIGDLEFAVVDDPSGNSEIYQPGQTVPGLGRLVAVEADRAVFEAASGRIELHLLPAPTATRSATAAAAAPRPPARTTTPTDRRRPFRSASEPSP